MEVGETFRISNVHDEYVPDKAEMSEKLEIAHDMVYKNSRLLNIGEGHV